MGYRSQRIRQLLTATAKVSPQDVATMQLDTKDLFAPTLVKALLSVRIDDPFAAEGQQLLRSWDATMPSGRSASGAAAAYYNAVWANLLKLTFDDEMGGLTAGGDSRWMRAMALLLDKPKSAWWDNKQTPTIVEGRDEILRQAMVQARLDLTERIGKDPRSWQWGELHTVTLRGPLASALPGPLAWLFTEGPGQVGGGTSLVNAMTWDSATGYQVVRGPSMRMVVDMANLDASRWVNQSGQSGHPTSPHVNDQFEAWLAGETYAWPFTRSAVEKASVETLTLTPSAG